MNPYRFNAYKHPKPFSEIMLAFDALKIEAERRRSPVKLRAEEMGDGWTVASLSSSLYFPMWVESFLNGYFAGRASK